MSQFYFTKQDKCKSKDLKMKIDGLSDRSMIRIGKIHLDLSKEIGSIDRHFCMVLQNSKYKGSTIEFDLSVCHKDQLPKKGEKNTV
jgi:hypothetical protein